MAAAGIYTIGGSFWEFGEPDWERTRYLLMFGVAEDHDSNPIKIGLGKLKGRPADRRAKFVSVNPIRTGYSAIADEWIGIRPGTDGMFVLALVHELLRADKIDLDFLARYSNAPWLVVQDPGGAGDGLIARDGAGHPLCWDKQHGQAVDALLPDVAPAMVGEFTLPDGRRAVPVFQLLAMRYLDARYSPDEAAKVTGVPAATIRRIAAELAHAAFEQQIELEIPWTDWAGRRHERMIGRPVSMHAMRGISAHSNGFHTCRAIHLLQILLGSIDCPGGWRYKPPFPRHTPLALKPAGKPGDVKPNTPLPGPPLGFPTGPEDLLVAADGTPQRIDKAFSWEAPLAAHGLHAHGHRQRPQGRSLSDRYAVPVHGEHELELRDEHRRDHGHAHRQGRGERRVQDPAHHLRRRLLLRDGGLRGSGAAGHHLSRAPRLHLAVRPPDLRCRWRRRRHPPAGGEA